MPTWASMRRCLEPPTLVLLSMVLQMGSVVCICVYICLCMHIHICIQSICIDTYDESYRFGYNTFMVPHVGFLCVCVSVPLYIICIYMYLCSYAYVCIYACTCVCVCMYLCMYVCMHVCIYVSMYLCTYVCMYVCMYVCAPLYHTCGFMCVCLPMYISTTFV